MASPTQSTGAGWRAGPSMETTDITTDTGIMADMMKDTGAMMTDMMTDLMTDTDTWEGEGELIHVEGKSKYSVQVA